MIKANRIEDFVKYDDGYYDGEFNSDNQRDGYGILTYSDKRIYEGNWKNDMINGLGRMKFTNGDIYEGEFKDNQRNGQGKYIYYKGNVYEGEFKDDYFIKGTIIFKDGNIFVGEGEFTEEVFVFVKGIMTFRNGNIFEGEGEIDFINGIMKGKMKYKKGGLYEGNFKNFLRNGEGKMIYKNGDIYDGEWIDDIENGNGKMKKQDGSILEGTFDDGEFIYPTISESIEELRDIITKNNLSFNHNNRANILLDNLLDNLLRKNQYFENKIYHLNRIIMDKDIELRDIREPNYYDKYERCGAVY